MLDGDSGTAESVGIGNTANIVGGSGITTVVAATDTLTVAIDNGNGIIFESGQVAVDESYGFAWTGAQSWSTTATFNGTLDANGVVTLGDGGDTMALNSSGWAIDTGGNITGTTWAGTTIAPTYGGTGLASYTTGDTLYASATNTLAALGIGTSGYVLRSNGTTPYWSDNSMLGTDDQTLAEVYAESGNAVQLTAGYGDIRFYNDGASEMLFLDESSGNVGIGTTAPGRTLFVSGDAGGTGAWNNDSHSSYKEDFEDVTVLDNILQLNIKEWQFKEEILPEDTNRHLSPFSEDFRNQFGLGDSDYHIQASDVAGVALKGVQEIARRVNLTNAPTSTSSLIIDSNGNFGIATNTPTNILTIGQGMGNAIADGWDVYSSEEYKTDITYLEEKDYDDILEEIEGINVATYRWKTDVVDDSYFESTASSTNLGIIAEEAPDRVLSNDGKSVSLYDYTTFAIAGVKGG